MLRVKYKNDSFWVGWFAGVLCSSYDSIPIEMVCTKAPLIDWHRTYAGDSMVFERVVEGDTNRVPERDWGDDKKVPECDPVGVFVISKKRWMALQSIVPSSVE